MSSKRALEADAEVPVGKRLVPDFGEETPNYEAAKRQMQAFIQGDSFKLSRHYCAHPSCAKKVYVEGGLCKRHVKQCSACARQLMSVSALRYAACSPPSTIGFLSSAAMTPIVYCDECIKIAIPMPKYRDRKTFMYPVHLFEAEIGATGTDVTSSVVQMSTDFFCSFCDVNLVDRALSDRSDVALVGQELFCGQCAGINRTDCGSGVDLPMAGLKMCTTRVKFGDDLTGGVTSDACLTCRRWRFNDKCKCP